MPWWYSHTPDNSPRLADAVSNQMIRARPVVQQNPEHRTTSRTMSTIVVPPCCASPTHPDALQTGRDAILATDACDDTPDPDPERSSPTQFRITLIAMTDETINDQPVTDNMIEEWANEAETGYDVEKLRKRGRPALGVGPGAVVPVRMDAALLEALNARAEQEHVSRSEAIREAVRAWTQVA